MTYRRRQVRDFCTRAVMRGETITFARVARECGLYDYRHARRIVGDLRAMGQLTV